MPYETLSEYGFFVGPLAEMRPAPGVLPYAPVSTLFSDYAHKARFVVLPEGARVDFISDEDWTFPDRSVIIKSFYYPLDFRDPAGPRNIVETRLLIKLDGQWTAQNYLWNEEQTEAVRHVAGARVLVDYIDDAGQPVNAQEYVVPDTLKCANCHGRDSRLHLLGVSSRQLNYDVDRGAGPENLLEWFAGQELFSAPLPAVSTLPALVDPFGPAPLEDRARAYLDANCGHCHRSGAQAGATGLILLASETNPTSFGICKSPVAAGAGSGGRSYDIHPGDASDSIIPFRMASTDPAIRMPELPNLLVHREGIDLISAWIDSITPAGCPWP